MNLRLNWSFVIKKLIQIPKVTLFVQFHIDRVYANLKEGIFYENHYKPEKYGCYMGNKTDKPYE